MKTARCVSKGITAAVFAGAVLFWAGCNPVGDSEPTPRFGKAAEAEIAGDAHVPLPKHTEEHFYFHTGWGGSRTTYWSMKCASVDDCFASVSGHAPRDEFGPYYGTKRPFVVAGPAYFGEKYSTEAWQLAKVKNGSAYEWKNERGYVYCLIDEERCRVFFCKWLGSYPRDERSRFDIPVPDALPERGQ